MHDRRDLFAAPFDRFLRRDEQRQLRPYGCGDAGKEQRGKARRMARTPRQIALEHQIASGHPRFIGHIPDIKQGLFGRLFSIAEDDVVRCALGQSRGAVKPFAAFIDLLANTSRKNDGCEGHPIFTVGNDRCNDQLFVGRKFRFTGTEREFHAQTVAFPKNRRVSLTGKGGSREEHVSGQQARRAVYAIAFHIRGNYLIKKMKLRPIFVGPK